MSKYSPEEFYSHIWHKKWSDEVLNDPALASRRKRSHNLIMISLDKGKIMAEFQSGNKYAKDNVYVTTLADCTCRDFLLGHGKRPCKHIFRLAEELGLFYSEKFEQNEGDYSFDCLPPELKVLPKTLRTASNELVDKYLMILRFIVKGRKKHIKKLEGDLINKKKNENTEKERNSLKNYYDFQGEAREIKQYKLKSESDELLQQLIDMGLIETIEKDMTVTIRLAQNMTLDDVTKIMEIYGENIPLFTQSVAKKPLDVLSQILVSKKRSEQILRPHDAFDTPDWAFFVPEYFNDALDIKLVSRTKNLVGYTAWTQGIDFAFDTGDVIYRDKDTYQKGTPALQVISAKKAQGTKAEKLNTGSDSETEIVGENTETELFDGYYPGEVSYRDFEAGIMKTTTQMNFVKMLIGINEMSKDDTDTEIFSELARITKAERS